MWLKLFKNKTMTKLQAIRKLYEHDHSFLKPEFANKIAHTFGISPNLYEAVDTRSEFKGLTLYGDNPKTGKPFKEGDKALGIDADVLAEQIADHCKAEHTPMFGRGSNLRECCSAVEELLLKEVK
jgi:hypothetical protein